MLLIQFCHAPLIILDVVIDDTCASCVVLLGLCFPRFVKVSAFQFESFRFPAMSAEECLA